MVHWKDKGTFSVKLVRPFKQTYCCLLVGIWFYLTIIILIKYNRFILSTTQTLVLWLYKNMRDL